jgi:hypothetical protein
MWAVTSIHDANVVVVGHHPQLASDPRHAFQAGVMALDAC